jgi:hypothetical protein
MWLLRSRSGSRTKIRGGQEELVRLRIERHTFRPVLGRDVVRTCFVGVRLFVVNWDSACIPFLYKVREPTGEQNARIMKQLASAHESKAGVYGAVLVEGTIRPGDEISLMD